MIKKILLGLAAFATAFSLYVSPVFADDAVSVTDADDTEETDSITLEDYEPEFYTLDDTMYLACADGTNYTGWYQTKDGNKMYCDPEKDGAVTVGPHLFGEDYYLFTDQGYLIDRSSTSVVGGCKYWTGADGILQTGWLYLGNWKMYFDPETFQGAESFTEIDGKMYLFNQDGVMQTYAGTTIINGEKYWFSDGDASLKTGWLDLGGALLYFDPETYAAIIGFATINGEGYLFDSNGVLVKRDATPVWNGEKYWTSSKGTLKTGWLNLGDWKMYFQPDTYTAAVSFNEINGKTYLFNDDGVMQTYAGTTIINGKKYWFSDDDACLKTGWLTLGSWKMYFDPDDFAAVTGTSITIDGTVYTFNDDGVLTSSYTPSAYSDLVYNGSSSIPYVQWAIDIANDNSHGYAQDHRNGDPDFDCSSLVYFALKNGGYPISDIVSYPFNTRNEESVLTQLGFEKIPFDETTLQEGDILWRSGHTEIYVGGGKSVGAHYNENADIVNGEPGDQTGNEISVVSVGYYSYVFRDPTI